MTRSSAGRFAAQGLLVATLAATVMLLATWSQGTGYVAWTFAGWSLMVLVGLAGGVWMIAWHGRPDAGFIVAVGACMLTRLIVAAAGALAAVSAGGRAIFAYSVGLATGYLPLQVFETVWFMRSSGRGSSPGETK